SKTGISIAYLGNIVDLLEEAVKRNFHIDLLSDQTSCHNVYGGGVGIGKAINGGFGLLLDGSERVDEIIKSAIMWDVMGGVARRSWARNEHALSTAAEYNKNYAGQGHITLPFLADDGLVDKTIDKFVK
ncbi:MAG: hypothetical protein GX671_03740, partial [Clostridiales bacterium]|nr:hypothetical protein [Clostridiales bacterium]